ncbi:alpha/beta hydrolase [Streptomyces cadmiisoli]|uniref:Alpha/beta hydrolase n=1 Tax=Streptomyces cadmiisoli TaxID=2184053 RepID=A0A2Z4ITG6_9ACTN|nr:alpha/beta hydrolase [Streptomyces cadmiisoli]
MTTSGRRGVTSRREVTLRGAAGTLSGDLWELARPLGTVILLHGGGQTRHPWRDTGARIAEHGWSAFAYDARGHGTSSWAADGNYSLPALVEDLMLVAGAMKPPFVLVGASLGGHTAILGQDANPGLAVGLALVDIVPQMEPKGVERVLAFMASHPQGFESLVEAEAAIARFKGDGRGRTRTPRPGLRKNLRMGLDGRWHWHWDPRFLTHAYRPGTAQAAQVEDAARRLKVPVTLLAGERSDLVPASRVEAFGQLVPHADVQVVTAADHMITGDDGSLYLHPVVNFVNGLTDRM